MLEVLKKYFNFSALRPAFLIIFSLAVFGLAGSRFLFVKAAHDRVNVFPSSFSAETGDEKIAWQAIGKAFVQDLSAQAGLEEFSQDNAAFILSGGPVDAAASSTGNIIGADDDVATTTGAGGMGEAPASMEEKNSEHNNQDWQNEAEGKADDSGRAGQRENKDNNDAGNRPENSGKTEEAAGPAADEPAGNSVNAEPAPESQPSMPAFQAQTGDTSFIPEKFLRNLARSGRPAFSRLASFFRSEAAHADDDNSEETVEGGEKKDEEKKAGEAASSIVFSDFSLPADPDGRTIGNIQLRASFAGRDEAGGAVRFYYALAGNTWQEAGGIVLGEEKSNARNGGYFLFAMPILLSSEDVGRLKIKASYEAAGAADKNIAAYLDAVWLEIDYEEVGDKKGEVRGAAEENNDEAEKTVGDAGAEENKEYDLKLASLTHDFKTGDRPDFKFNFKKKRGVFASLGFAFLSLFYDYYKDIKIDAAVTLPNGKPSLDFRPKIEYLKSGEFKVSLDDRPRQFKSGRYRLKINIADDWVTDGQSVPFSQNFTWGVLAVNANKSIYLPGETAYLQMAVLDDLGHTLCGAGLAMEITAPDGGLATLSTANGLIVKNPECGPDNVIDTPDYFAHYQVSGAGNYQIRLTAETPQGQRTVEDQFEVRGSVPFDIERQGPTRIYPKADYAMKIKIRANEDFSGEIAETVPESFGITDYELRIANSHNKNQDAIRHFESVALNGEKIIKSPNINLKSGDEAELVYRFDAPDVSPEFYLLGPFKIGNFQEARQWQIASDAVTAYNANAGTSAGTWIGLPSLAWDSTNNTYAIRDVVAGVDETTIYIQSTGNTATDLGGTISQVEIGVEGYVERTYVNARLRPVFGGSTVGTTIYTVPGTSLTIADTGATFYVDITNDNGAPAVWTWNDIINLDVRVHGQNTGGTLRELRIDQIRYRVTYNRAPTSTIQSLIEKTDGSGTVDLSVAFADQDSDNSRARMDYATGTTCNFSTPGDPTLDATDANATSTLGDAKIDNASAYQIGTTTGWILTTGANTVNFDWLAKTDLPNTEGWYCVRITANDQTTDQATSATSTVYIDTKAPTAPGTLGFAAKTQNSITLSFGASTTETNFREYKIFYATSSPVMDSGPGNYEYSSSTNPGDPDLGQQNYNNTSTTTIANLAPNTLYYFNIWAYDLYGNKASSTVIATTTHALPANPTGPGQFKNDGVTAIANGSWTNENNVKLKASTTDAEVSEILSLYFQLVPNASSTLTATTVPVGACAWNADYAACSSNIWATSSPVGNYSATPFVGMVNPTGLPDSSAGYKWQVLACDSHNYCSNAWTDAGADPNFKSDATAPTAPGILSEYSKSTSTITLLFGASSIEANFKEYKIFYATTSPVLDVGAGNYEYSSSTVPGDPDLGQENYNNTSTTTLTGLQPGTQYFINIWAYDLAGNKATSTQIFITTNNNSPSGVINSAAQKDDGSGAVDISVTVSDPDGNNSRARIDFVAGAACNFALPLDPTLDETDANASSTFGDAKVDNGSVYQVGTTSGWIITSSGANTVNFDWLSKTDIPLADGDYCIRLTANDGTGDQVAPATEALIIDNTAPSQPGQLILDNFTPTSTTGASLQITFGSESADTHFNSYKIYYKQGAAGVSEADALLATMVSPDYGGATSTFLSNLEPQTNYVFNIWAYDDYGNKASSTEISITTGDAEPIRANTVEFFGGAYSANGSIGQNSNTNNTLPSFSFRLGESGLAVRNAYLIFEAQYKAYSGTTAYSSSTLAFDACANPCTPAAFTGSGNIVRTDTSVLSYTSIESNDIRLILDVTNEAQLAGYQGNNTLFNAEVGYSLNQGSVTNSIANAKAKLVVTYTYNQNSSVNLTKTVVYPLESTVSGDSGARRAVQAVGCTLDSNCPLFNYNMDIPEYGAGSTRASQWFEMYGQNDMNGTNDLTVNVNIQGTNINSPLTYVHESALGGTQSALPVIYYNGIQGYGENTAQTLEYYGSTNGAGGGNFYAVGGETFETFIASSSAPTKTRTVAFPIGVIVNDATTATNYGNVNVYFPENGYGAGNVTVKKAWFRVITSNSNSGGQSVTLSSKVGINATSSTYVYNYDPGSTAVKPTFNIIHVIPSGDYAELAQANISSPKNINLAAAGSNNAGGVSAELIVTYAYTNEDNGYLVSNSLFAGQSLVNASSTLVNLSTANMVAPEISGTKTIRAGALVSSILTSDQDGTKPNSSFTTDANIATSSPSCANAYVYTSAAYNTFSESYHNVAAALVTTDNQVYTACYSNYNGSDTDGSLGGKMGGQLIYTYQWNAPPPVFTENDWRWYKNVDALTPTTPKAAENATATQINIGDALRLRMNIGMSDKDLATSSANFKLQYAWGADCPAITSSSWRDVGATSSSESWRGFDNPSVADGAAATSTLLASSTVKASYEEMNASVMNPYFIPKTGFGEWDWVLYNNSATSSQDYCFRMVKGDGSALDYYASDSYAKLTTAPANTAPANPSGLGQYKNDGASIIPNQGWASSSDLKLRAATTDPNINTAISLYFEFVSSSTSFTNSTSSPCVSGTAFGACSSKVWVATSTTGDYRDTAFIGTTTITGIPEGAEGAYKWQVAACDQQGGCSAWMRPGADPNLRLDLTAPTAPGSLTAAQINATSLTVNFGVPTVETNFYKYKIFYKVGTSGVTEANTLFSDPDGNLNYINYNGKATTTINSLAAGTTYAFNIWAYDLAGNKASSTQILVATTTSSFTPPTAQINNMTQEINGSGAVNITLAVDDQDNDDTLRARVEYAAYNGNPCASSSFYAYNKATIDETDANTTALNGDPKTDMNQYYQVGSSTGWIITSPGQNFVFFDWLSKIDAPAANDSYCIRVIVNDGSGGADNATVTSMLLVDNVAPTVPGALTFNKKTKASVTLNFGSQSTDTHFDRYRVFYGTSTPVTPAMSEQSDANLLAQNFNLAATTTVANLLAGTLYYFNIWAYDDLGNSASSSIIASSTTNSAPSAAAALAQFKDNETTALANGAWTNESTVKLTAAANDADTSEVLTLYFQAVTNASSFTTATSEPTGACVYGTAFNSCSSKIWFVASSSPGDYSVAPFRATTSITAIPDAAAGYKWQVLACDDDADCAVTWTSFGAVAPHFKVDTVAPTAPGILTENSKTSGEIILAFGASTTEANFDRYRIFYATSSPVSEASIEHIDNNLNYKNYNGASLTTVNWLESATQYYFNIWAYDLAGNKASSTVMSVTTNAVVPTPGVIFYSRNNRNLYYKVWSGSAWGSERSLANMVSAGYTVKHIRVARSDDGGKIGIVVKAFNGTNSQQFWGTVYKVAANTFVNTQQLGSNIGTGNYASLASMDIAALSGDEFFVVRSYLANTNGTIVHNWNTASGWNTTGVVGPNNFATTADLKLTRRPGSDNYTLSTRDNSNDMGVAYYYGGAAFANTWTQWQELSQNEEDINIFVGEIFFDPSDNTRGAVNYRNNIAGAYTAAQYFTCSNNAISYGTASNTPATYANDWVNGEFAVDPAGTGIAYFVGGDVNNELNVYKIDIGADTPAWSVPANSDNLSNSLLYAYTNYTHYSHAIDFYKKNKGVVTWNISSVAAPRYKVIDAAADALDAASSNVPGAAADNYSRVRIYDDPNENEFLAVYQNNNIDYQAVFWDGKSNRFYSSATNPGSGQIWTDIATSVAGVDLDDELATFAFTKVNSAPDTPLGLNQYRSNGTTVIANGSWITDNQVKLNARVTDADTSEAISLYFEFISASGAATTTNSPPAGACASTTAYAACASKIWAATSSVGDYSVNAFSGTTTITSIPDSGIGYQWQVMACDDDGKCSAWAPFNVSLPNVKIDITAPTAFPNALGIGGKTSTSIILNYLATTTEPNFDRYRIYYSTTTPVTESMAEHSDSNLLNILYNGAATTTVYNLSASTTYYFNIWAYDLAGNKASSTIIATTTNQSAYLRQSSYLMENDDGTDVNANSMATSTYDSALLNTSKGERLNVRIQLENSGGDTAANKVYRLQFDVDGLGNWQDVGNTTAVSYSLGLSGSLGNSLSGNKAAPNTGKTWRNGTWQEGVNKTGNFTLYSNEFTEFVFAVETSNAVLGASYRLRLVNDADGSLLNAYGAGKYPTIGIVSAEARRYAKDVVASLTAGTGALSYWLDPKGYVNTLNDDGIYDVSTSTGNTPVFNLIVATSSNTQALNPTWNGQSSRPASAGAVYLQVYRFGTTNAWVTIASNTTADANADFNLTGNINSNLSQYYYNAGGYYLVYWRVYQAAGSEALRTDSFAVSYTAPVAEIRQTHYRWRDDNGTEATATWREAEDAGDPTLGSFIAKNTNIRLRLSAVNTGGGSAADSYQLQYATTSSNCLSDPGGWTTVPTSTAFHFKIATTTNFGDGSSTAARLANSEGYAFTAGWMVKSPSNTAASITLAENNYTEVEYAMQATDNSTTGGTYCFRVTNAGVPFNYYERYAELTVAGTPNSQPLFTAYPADGGSASTSPTNYGTDVFFNAIASTTDGGDYYLAICKTNSATAGNDAAPTCNGGAWCVSGLASSTEEASCNYTSATSSEELAWYGFACDKHPGTGVAKCSPVSQGDTVLSNGSPFAINHPPVLTSASSSIDYQDPGGTILVSTASYDNDSAGGADVLTLYVCTVSGASPSGCTVATSTVCSAVATSSPNAKCDYNVPLPSPGAAVNYYAYIFDNHNLAAAANPQTSSYHVNNVAPTLGTYSLLMNPIILNTKGTTTAVSAATTISDPNGCSDIDSATAATYVSNVSGGYNCTANNNNCYQINTANCVISDCAGSADLTASITCTANMAYYALPTDISAGNPNEPYNWLSRIIVNDGVNLVPTSSAAVELNTSQALDVSEAQINFGSSMYAGENTGTSTRTTTVVNAGNCPINTLVSGTDMSGNPSGTITVGNIEWDLTKFFSYTSGVDLTTLDAAADTNTPKATSTADVIDYVYWGLGIPYGSPVSIYSGTNYFSATIDSADW